MGHPLYVQKHSRRTEVIPGKIRLVEGHNLAYGGCWFYLFHIGVGRPNTP
jgi:hypothetical protein